LYNLFGDEDENEDEYDDGDDDNIAFYINAQELGMPDDDGDAFA
jgi:hypothetical protein